MAIDVNKHIFKPNTATQNWGSVQGQQILTASSEQRRGGNLKLGAEYMAQINAILNKWSDLNILANAKVSLIAQAQGQTPLDLFNEAGLAIRLQAVLEAAVAVGLNMNLTMGQLLAQLKTKPYGVGLSGELIELLLNETELEGSVFGQYAIGFMAFANLVFVGSLHNSEQLQNPGFQFVYEAGMGFIVGGGYRSYLRVDIPNSRMLVDLFSSKLIDGIVRKAFQSQHEHALLLGTMLKIGVRASYEVSDKLSTETNLNSEELSRKLITIIWDQLQPLVLLQAGLLFRTRLLELLEHSGLSLEQTSDVNRRLKEIAPFSFPGYNDGLFNNLLAITRIIQDEQMKKSVMRELSALWAIAILMLPPAPFQEGSPFPEYTGPLPTQLDSEVIKEINSNIQEQDDMLLTKEGLLKFILSPQFAQAILQVENIRDVTAILSPALGTTPQQVLTRLFAPEIELASIENFQQLLSSLGQSFDTYIDREISGRSVAVSNNLSDEPEIQTLYNEALLPSIQILSDIVLPEAANGFQNFDRKTMLEVLSSPLLAMLGRSVVYVIQAVSTFINDQIETLLLQAVNKISSVLEPLGVQQIVQKPLEAAAKIIADSFAPLPQPVLEQLFESVLQIFTPIDGNAVNYADRLKEDSMYIPQQEELENIGRLLGILLSENMNGFAVKIIPSLFKALIDELLQVIEQLLTVLTDALNVVSARIAGIVKDKILGDLVDYFIDLARKSVDAISFDIFDLIGTGRVKDAFFNALDGAVRSAVERVVLPIVLLPFESLRFDSKKVVDLFRNVSDLTFDIFIGRFSEFVFSEIERQIGNTLRMKRIGLDVNVPVSFKISVPPFGERTFSHIFTITDLVMPSSVALELIMNTIRNNLNFAQSPRLLLPIFKTVVEILEQYKQITQLQFDMQAAIQKYAQI